MHVAVLIVLACVLLLARLLPHRRIGERAGRAFKAGLIGLLLELAFIPTLVVTVVLLVVTIVGIPLLGRAARAAGPGDRAAGRVHGGRHRLGARPPRASAGRFRGLTSRPRLASHCRAPLLLSRILGAAIGGFGS